MPSSRVLVAICCFAPALPAFGQSTPLGLASVWSSQTGAVATDDYLLLEVAPGIVLKQGRNANGGFVTGVGDIDALNVTTPIVEVGRLFPDPPRGHRDPASFSRLGLDRMYYMLLKTPRPDVVRVAQQYSQLGSVVQSWTDAPIAAAQTPNDPDWTSQWNMTAGNLDAPAGWDIATGATVLISVIDSGGDLTHPDLVNNLWINPGEIAGNGIDDDGNGYIDDVNGWDFWNGDAAPDDDMGHGTHVSGILGADGNNGINVAGVCWSAQIQEVKVLNESGAGTWASVAEGVIYAADSGASVTNTSLGGIGGDPSLSAAIDYAHSLDVVQVAAAGNNGNNTPYYPAAYDHVIAVMATDASQLVTSWSNYGDWCDVCAPGDTLLSLWKGGTTAWLSGTSMASPHVAGIAALVRTINPQLDALDTELVIRYATNDLGAPGLDPTYQWGLADLGLALAKAGNLTLSTQDATIGTVVTLDVDRPDEAGSYYLILPSLSGCDPGLLLAPYFANDARTLPVNPDFLTSLAVTSALPQVFVNFSGLLDANGQATASFAVPAVRKLSGVTVSFCGLTFSATDFSTVRQITNSVSLRLH